MTLSLVCFRSHGMNCLQCAQWFLPGARCWRTMMHAAGTEKSMMDRCQDVRRKYAQDVRHVACQSETFVCRSWRLRVHGTCSFAFSFFSLPLLVDHSTRLHRCFSCATCVRDKFSLKDGLVVFIMWPTMDQRLQSKQVEPKHHWQS